MNYQHADSAYISHTIWVDSAIVEGADSVFFTNRIVKDVPGNPEIVLRNQPQFFGKYLVKQQYGFYLIGDPYNYTIYAYGDLGESWSFTGTSGISAEVTSLFTESVFGVTDSVKVISLSDGNEIKLTKNFGILQFPDFENGGYFELVGIQDTEFGESVPGFWEIYDFEVGDVFQYTGEVGGGSSMYIDYYTKKYTIEAKIIQDDQINYSIFGYRNGYYWDLGSPWNSYGYSEVIEEDVIYNLEDDHYINLYPNQITRLWDGWCSQSYDENTYAKCKIYKDTNQVIKKQVGFKFKEGYGNTIGELYAIPNEFTDTLLRFIEPFPPEGAIGITIKKNLGITEFIAYYFEDQDLFQLEGYIKNGDTVGTITPDSLLFSSIKDERDLEDIRPYPNPAKEQITFLNLQIGKNPGLSIHLLGLDGKFVQEFQPNNQTNSFSVSDLKPGLYIYTITQNQEIIKRGKLIIQ